MRHLSTRTLTALPALALIFALTATAAAAAPAPQDAGAGDEAEVPQPVPQEVPRLRKSAEAQGAAAARAAKQQAVEATAGVAAEGYDDTQLDELVAPVALYPDVLLNQVLVACETPGDLAAADKLAQREAAGPIKPAKSWSAGVTALMHVPSVLHWLDESRIWSSQLGAAYKSHPRDVISAIQRVRKQAQELGNLASDDQRDIEVAFGKVTIALADPAVLHVPVYDPTQVLEQHTADCPEWFGYGPPVSIPGFKSIDAGFRSIEFTRAKRPESPNFYKPAPPLVPTVTTTVKRGGGGGGLRWLRGGDHRDRDDHHGHHHGHH